MLSYRDFVATVMCYLDNIYVYLRARAAGAVGRGKPEKIRTV